MQPKCTFVKCCNLLFNELIVHWPPIIMNKQVFIFSIKQLIYHNLKCQFLFSCFCQEWLDSRCRGVRSANAYILVYDICCVESFEYVKMIRQQIVDNRYTT